MLVLVFILLVPAIPAIIAIVAIATLVIFMALTPLPVLCSPYEYFDFLCVTLDQQAHSAQVFKLVDSQSILIIRIYEQFGDVLLVFGLLSLLV